MPDNAFTARLDALCESLGYHRLPAEDARPKGPGNEDLARHRRQEATVAAVSRQLQQLCFTEPGIASSPFADPAALTPAQLEPARQFRQWLAQRLAATDWAAATQARRARVLWLEVLPSQPFSNGPFSYWRLAAVLPREASGLAPVLGQLLEGPDFRLDRWTSLSILLEKVVALEMQLPGLTREAMWPVLPRLLRVRPGDSQHLRQLAAHPQAAEEVPRLLYDIFTHSDPGYYWGYPLAAWLAEAPMEALLGPALPHLRHYLGRLTQPQLTEFLKELPIKDIIAETRLPNEALDCYAASPNRLGLLALLAELATAPALAALTQAALARAQARRQELAAAGPTGPTK